MLLWVIEPMKKRNKWKTKDKWKTMPAAKPPKSQGDQGPTRRELTAPAHGPYVLEILIVIGALILGLLLTGYTYRYPQPILMP